MMIFVSSLAWSVLLVGDQLDPGVHSERVLTAEDGILQNPSFDLAVVKVQSANEEHDFAVVEVEEVLRGRIREGEAALARWRRPHNPFSYSGALPAPGERLLVAAISSRPRRSLPNLKIVRTFEANHDNLSIARAAMVRSPSPWPTLLFALAAWTVVSFARILPSPIAANLGIGASIVLAIACVFSYVAYERQMSPFVTIRLDILLLLPAVFSCLGIPVFVWWFRRQQRRGDFRDV